MTAAHGRNEPLAAAEVHPQAQIRRGDAPDEDTLRICWPVISAALNDLATTAL